jgi:hypothetical protein
MPQTFTILSTASRATGSFASVSAQIPTGVESVYCALTMNDANRTDTANRLRWVVEISPNGADEWKAVHIDEWQGGTIVDKQTGATVGKPSTIGLGCPPSWWGMYARLTIEVINSTRFGATLTVNP